MTKIVRERYPLSKLPEDLRDGLPVDGEATVIVETAKVRAGYTLAELLDIKKTLPVSSDDPVERIRAVRDGRD